MKRFIKVIFFMIVTMLIANSAYSLDGIATTT